MKVSELKNQGTVQHVKKLAHLEVFTVQDRELRTWHLYVVDTDKNSYVEIEVISFGKWLPIFRLDGLDFVPKPIHQALDQFARDNHKMFIRQKERLSAMKEA